MTALAGIGGSFTEGSTTVSSGNKWTLDIKQAVKDVTTFGATGNWALNIPTLKSWTGKLSVFFDPSDAGLTNLLGLIGSTVALVLNVSGTPHGFSGNAIITEIAPSVDVQGAITADISFTGTGAVAYS